MPITIDDDKVRRKGHAIFEVTFTKEDGTTTVVPDSITWDLADVEGNIINARDGVSITPAATVDIVLEGDDLDFQAGESGEVERVLTINSVTDMIAQDNLPMRESAHFFIEDLFEE